MSPSLYFIYVSSFEADSPGQKDFKARMGRTSPRELLNGRRQAERSYGILTPPFVTSSSFPSPSGLILFYDQSLAEESPELLLARFRHLWQQPSSSCLLSHLLRHSSLLPKICPRVLLHPVFVLLPFPPCPRPRVPGLHLPPDAAPLPDPPPRPLRLPHPAPDALREHQTHSVRPLVGILLGVLDVEFLASSSQPVRRRPPFVVAPLLDERRAAPHEVPHPAVRDRARGGGGCRVDR